MSSSLLIDESALDVIVRFNRPEIRSPLSVSVIEELTNVLDGIALDTERRIVFTGVGEVFASGADLREIKALKASEAKDFAELGQRLMNHIEALPNETVVAVNGPCYGGALDLALACKRRVATPNATFCHPGTGLGIITGWGGTQRLPRLIGQAIALEMFFTASPINASRALEIGLISEIRAPEDLLR